MGGPLRSKQGCWTCRLRKKKCDEGHPQCLICRELLIPCYGFGSKPVWMNGGVEEKAVAHSLKEIVKHTWRSKGTSHSITQRDAAIDRARTPPIVFVEDSTKGQGSSQSNAPPLLDCGSSQRVEVTKDGARGTIFSISAEESALLMHFLDKVFSLQFPVYNPGMKEGGRGWLLSLLLRTKPLYHAALALSAYHRRTIVHANLQQSCKSASLVQQEEQLQSSIQSLHHFVQSSCTNNGLGVVTSVIQLMFFELFTGHGNLWQAHLRAAMDMLPQAHEHNLKTFGLADKSITILCEDLTLSEYDPEVAEEVANFRFLRSTTIWLDIIASITTGTVPNLLPYHSRYLTADSLTKLENTMGCENWVMFQVGRIAALYQHKLKVLRQRPFDCREIEHTALDIARVIHCSLNQETLQTFDVSEREPITMFDGRSDRTVLVTHIFAYMALAYLHLVMYGFQKLNELETIISGAMKVFRTSTPRSLLPVLVSPLFIIACVTEQEDERFFRNVFSSLPLLDPFFQHRGGILPALEEIWRSRTTPGFAWADCLGLIEGVLLL